MLVLVRRDGVYKKKNPWSNEVLFPQVKLDLIMVA